MRACHDRDRVFEALALAGQCGINAIMINPSLGRVLNVYRRASGRIQEISDCYDAKDVLAGVRRPVDDGARVRFISGAIAGELAAKGQFDLLAKRLDTSARRACRPAWVRTIWRPSAR